MTFSINNWVFRVDLNFRIKKTSIPSSCDWGKNNEKIIKIKNENLVETERKNVKVNDSQLNIICGDEGKKNWNWMMETMKIYWSKMNGNAIRTVNDQFFVC